MAEKKQNLEKGSLLIYLIIAIFVFIVVMFPVVMVFAAKLQLLRLSVEREEALQIADAGINYYQWHLAHFPTDYQDGTNTAGPYVHDYFDYDTQEEIGKFSLTITPPPVGSTIVTIESTGWANGSPGLKRTITARYGVSSLMKYAFISQSPAWIYASDHINGMFMDNGGIRFEGTTNAPVQSAKTTYTCFFGVCGVNGEKPGIWAEAPLSQSFWQFPVPAIDFSVLTSTLADMKTSATAPFYLPASGAYGYSLVFNNDGTVSVYIVNNLKSEPDGHYYVYGIDKAHGSTDYDSKTFLFTSPLPANGIIYAEDNVWVEGTVKGRVTVAAAKLGETDINNMPSIYIANSIVYQNKDGSDVLGLLAQRDIIYSYYTNQDLEVDAAEVTQYGSAQALFYGYRVSYSPGDPYLPSYYPELKERIKTYGSIMSYDSWDWTWSDETGSIIYSGFANTENDYDSSLLFTAPPGFPFASPEYQQLSWTSD